MRKFYRYLILVCFFLFFGKNILLETAGFFIKTYLHFQKGWSVEYTSLQWTGDGFSFKNLKVQENSIFILTAPFVKVSISQKHLEIEKPYLIVLNESMWEGNNRSGWSCVVHHGFVEGRGKYKGEVYGSFSLGSVSEGHLEGKGLGIDGICEGLEGVLDWKEGGSVEASFGGISLNGYERHGVFVWDILCRSVGSDLIFLAQEIWKKEIPCQIFQDIAVNGKIQLIVEEGSTYLDNMDLSIQSEHFKAEMLGASDAFVAHVQIQEPVQGDFVVEGRWTKDLLLCSAKDVQIKQGKIEMTDLAMEIEISKERITCLNAKGMIHLGKSFSFTCPVLEINGPFDFRLDGELCDMARFTGTFEGSQVTLDSTRSHILGSPVSLEYGTLWQLRGQLPWQQLSFLQKIPFSLPVDGHILYCLSYDSTSGVGLELTGQNLQCRLKQLGGFWQLESSRFGDLEAEGHIEFNDGMLTIQQGKGIWKQTCEAEMKGTFHSLDQWNLHITHLRCDLDTLFPELDMEGVFQGEGMLSARGTLEADFDVVASGLKIRSVLVENQEPLHVYYSSEKGISIRGVNLRADSGDCKIDLFHCDFDRVYGAEVQIHWIPKNLQLTMDFESAIDFSSLSCFIKEASIPWKKEVYSIRNCHINKDSQGWLADFDFLFQNHFIPMELSTARGKKGNLKVHDTLLIEWTYDDRLEIQSIDGNFSGLDASFHLEGDSLVGSARINCQALKTIVPPKIAEVFTDLKMGSGYELMGRLKIDDKGLSFKGILGGKQIELFDFQLKTLLAQIEFDSDHLKITDLKISDFSGILKIDQILAQGEGDAPWTLFIPHLTVTELRPSMLPKIGAPPGTLTPLVIRDLRINNLQGIADEKVTYTAQGELHFINSYKREDSILEIPSKLLSRIVGLDLDLLIPVEGTLRYELKNGAFYLTELIDAYSENKRSKFFLVDTPTVGLDGHLNILIKMKQFVLFKLTEAFMISVDGKLDDPDFHLQKKSR